MGKNIILDSNQIILLGPDSNESNLFLGLNQNKANLTFKCKLNYILLNIDCHYNITPLRLYIKKKK